MRDRSRWLAGSLLGAAVLTSSAAIAQPGSAYGYPDQHQQSGREANADDGASDIRDDEQSVPQEDVRAEDDFSDVVSSESQQADTPLADSSRSPVEDESLSSHIDREAGEITDACALAARDEAEADGGYAEVRQMGTPRESRSGFTVDGAVDVRSSWGAQDGRLRHFSCSIANGRVADIYFQRDRAGR